MKALTILLGLFLALSFFHGCTQASEIKELNQTITRLEIDLEYSVNRCREHPLCNPKPKTAKENWI